MKWLLTTLMLACGWGFAQPKTAPAKAPSKGTAATPAVARWPIESIAIDGNRIYSKDLLLSVAGLKVGQAGGKREFDAARDRLIATGAFEVVNYKFAASGTQGYLLTFQVSEIQQVYPVVFEDLHVSSKDLEAALRAKDPIFSTEKLPATQPVLERYTRWIQEYLTAKGIDEKIAGSVTPALPGDFQIVFRPARNLPVVALITFEGNQVVQQNALREAVSGVGIGSPFTDDLFRQLLNAAVRPVYEARGRLKVSFPSIRTEPAKDVEGLHVFVTVDEGPSYELGKVSIEGPAPLANDVLLKAGDFKAGDVANMERVTEGLERIRKAVRHVGYMDAKVTSDRHIDEGKKALDVTVHVDAGPQYLMAKLTIVGLDLGGEAEMRRIWTMKDGKPFNPDYPDLFLKRVKDEGMFDDLGETKADYKLNSREHTADVTLNFKGSNPLGKPGRHGRGGGME